MKKCSVILILVSLLMAGCNHTDQLRADVKEKEILTIHDDGRMVLNDRPVSSKDVIIYSDGKGLEKAAVKIYIPYHPPYFRDSIIVERLD